MDYALELLITSGLMSALLQRELLIPHFFGFENNLFDGRTFALSSSESADSINST
jgi:hypothetical protein